MSGTSSGPAVETQPAALTAREAIARYDRLAPGYDTWSRLFESHALDRALAAAAVRDGDRALEVAVGVGRTLVRIAAANPAGLTAGVDASREMLVRARQRTRTASVRFALADCRRLPLRDGAFDLVVSAYLLDLLSLDDIRRTLGEIRRALRPAGRLVLVSMTHGGLLMRLWRGLYRHSPALLGGCRSVATSPLVEEAGFSDVQREVVRQLGFPSEVVTARKPPT